VTEQTFKVSNDKLKLINFWVTEWARMWRDEAPVRIHSRDIDKGGAPEWHPAFMRYIDRGVEEHGIGDNGRRLPPRRNPDHRLRTTRAFRKLRKKNAREYEVLYRTSIQRIPVEETIQWLNERAIRNAKSERYTLIDVQILLLSAVDKVLRNW
jgi:hypothetical protein